MLKCPAFAATTENRFNILDDVKPVKAKLQTRRVTSAKGALVPRIPDTAPSELVESIVARKDLSTGK